MAINGCEFLDEVGRKYLNDLSEKVRDGKVVLFVGAGLSKNAVRKDGSDKGFPLWEGIVEKMLKKLYPDDPRKVEKDKYFYTESADKFEAEFGRDELNRFLEDILEDSQFLPGEIHRLICKFDWEIITTNLDTLLDRAFESVRNEFNVIYNDSQLTNKKTPCIYKINGCIKNAREEIIFTGEDFRRFAEKKPLIELYVKKCFIESTVLFVGFSLKDPAFQMIHGWVRDRLLGKSSNRIAYSIQSHIDEPTKKTWHSRGIRFIEISPTGYIDNKEINDRIFEIFNTLYLAQGKGLRQKFDDISPSTSKSLNLLKNSETSLEYFRKKAKKFEKESKLHCVTVQAQLQCDVIECIESLSKNILDDYVDDIAAGISDRSETEKIITRLVGKLIYITEKYFHKKQKENILLKLLKEIVKNLEKTDGKLFENKKATTIISKILDRFLMKDTLEIDDPNVWIMALYTALRIGVSQKMPPIDFFRRGFSLIRKAALEGNNKQKVSKDLHHYWLLPAILIGPLTFGETLLNISRKAQTKKYSWDIPEHIHYQLEIFLDDRYKCNELFLRALGNFRTSDDTEAFVKFSLMDDYLKGLNEEKFIDPFLERTNKSLSGKFSGETYRFRNILSPPSFPMNKNYFESAVQAIFNVVDKGKSIMFTGLAPIILSYPGFTIEGRDINALKQTSLCEFFLLSTIYDKPGKGKKNEKKLKDLITTMIDYGVIDKSNFLSLLLFRLEEVNLEKMVQEDVDNGLSRFLNGLVTFILCALPYLEREDLLKIKKGIDAHLAQIKIWEIREDMIRIIAYILNQIPGEDFTNILMIIFSLATTAHYSSMGLKFLKLSRKELSNKNIIKYSQLRLLLDRSLEKQGTPFDRDFITFMLNHYREELFPEEDKRLKEILKTYFEIKTEEIEHLSLQWLMDLQEFIDKGFLQLDSEMETRVRTFIDTASEPPEDLREWKLKIFDEKTIKVYRTFGHLFKDQVINKIIEVYRKDMRGTEVKAIELKDLDPQVQGNFAHLLKEIYKSEHHKSLTDTILQNIKEFVNESLAGGGCLGAFWGQLDKEEKSILITTMLNLWLPESEESILRAVKATGEFLKYKTDDEAMKELTNRLIYCIFSGSTAVKIQWCQVVAAHVKDKENKAWYTENKEKILDCVHVFKKETNLELLREFLELARLFKIEEVKETIDYLKDNAPYAEIRRAAQGFTPSN